jgi:hypothetical protein
MIYTALNRPKIWILLNHAIKNFRDRTTKTLHNEPKKVLQEVASHAAKLFEHDYAPLDINGEWVEFFALIQNDSLHMSSVGDPITLEEIEYALRICGQDKARAPSGLTVRHIQRANFAKHLVSLFNNAKKYEKVPEK